jgi:hypothetical protein
MAWLPLTSTTVEPGRLDMERWAAGGIVLSSVTTRYQLGFAFHAGSMIAPLRAAMPRGTWESAMNAAFSASTSAAKEARSIGGTGAPGGGSFTAHRRGRVRSNLLRESVNLVNWLGD